MEFVFEIWQSLRPYLIKIVTDATISILLWSFLWFFKWFTTSVLIIDGWSGQFIRNVHSIGAIVAFSAFGLLFIIDVINLHNKED